MPKVFTILMEYIQLASEAVVAVFLCVTLLLVDFKMTVVMGGILVFMTCLLYTSGAAYAVSQRAV